MPLAVKKYEIEAVPPTSRGESVLLPALIPTLPNVPVPLPKVRLPVIVVLPPTDRLLEMLLTPTTSKATSGLLVPTPILLFRASTKKASVFTDRLPVEEKAPVTVPLPVTASLCVSTRAGLETV